MLNDETAITAARLVCSNVESSKPSTRAKLANSLWIIDDSHHDLPEWHPHSYFQDDVLSPAWLRVELTEGTYGSALGYVREASPLQPQRARY